MTYKISDGVRIESDNDNNRQNGANDSQSSALKGVEEDFENDILQGELAALRLKTYNLASDAAIALDSKEDWTLKDYDTLIGNYIKILTARIKIDSGEDEIEKLIGLSTAKEENLSSSADSQEETDEI